MDYRFIPRTGVVFLLFVFAGSTATGLQTKTAAPQTPVVWVNHVQLWLDAETYEAITTSEFLRTEFGWLSTPANRSVRGNDATFLYFNRTFLEFFGPPGQRASGSIHAARQSGDAGIFFSVDRSSDLQPIFDAFTKQPGAAPRRVATKAWDGKTPFNDYVTSRDNASFRFRIGVSAYRPEFFTLLKIPLPETGELTREAYQRNRRAASGLLQNPLGTDVIGVTVALGDEEAEHLDGEMAALSYAKVHEAGTIEYRGPEFIMRVKPATASTRGFRVIGVKIALREAPKAAIEHRFGSHSVLRLSTDKTAEWVF